MMPEQRPRCHLSMTTAVVLEVEEWVLAQLDMRGRKHRQTLNQNSISVRSSHMVAAGTLGLDVWPWKLGVSFDAEAVYGLTHQILILPIDNSEAVKTEADWVPDGIGACP